MNGVELRPTTIEGHDAWQSFEVFYKDNHIGSVALFGNDIYWRFRTPNSMMWWRDVDQDGAIQRLIEISGNNS